MGCNCDKKDKARKNAAFTKTVVEINNPEQIVLLRKVVIPASMGTEQDVPAAIGKYKNVILEYEANKHLYFYSSDGIPTRVEANIPQEIYDDIADLKVNKQDKLTAGANIDITSDVISATYSNFTGTDGTSAGAAGLVPAPEATDAGKFLGADGNWDTVSPGPTVVQVVGNSTTDVMSQDAVSKLVYYQGNSNNGVHLGNTSATTAEATAIGQGATATANGSIALGYNATVTNLGAVSFPYCHDGGAAGVVNFGPFNSSFGYGNTNTRLLSGVHAPVSNTDAANKNYVDTAIGNLTIPTITMTTTDPGEGSALAADNFIGVYV